MDCSYIGNCRYNIFATKKPHLASYKELCDKGVNKWRLTA